MHGDQLAAGLDRQLEGLEDAARDGAAVDQRVADARDHDRELVAAEARDGVLGAHAAAQALGDGDEQRVADAVAERVVDGLEVVDVDEQDGGLAVVGELLAHALHEQRAVREVGERVVVGLVVELVLQGLKLVDRLLEPVVLERHGRVVGQRLQQAQVVGAERALEADAVGEHDRADRALLAGEHRDHRVADAAGLHVGAQVRGAERAA